MTLLVAKADGIVPANAEFTMDHYSVTDRKGPFWISLQTWVHTEDTDNPGGFEVKVEYVDPVGETRSFSTTIPLNDKANGINQIGPVPIERETTTSSLKFITTVLGSADTALVSYRVVMTPADETCELQELTLTPIP